MRKIIPDFKEVGASIKSFSSSFGLVPTIVLCVAAVAVLYLAWDSGSNAVRNAWKDYQIEQLEKRAAQAEEKAKQEEIEKEQYKGAAAAYQQESKATQEQLVEMFNERPELQKRSAAAAKRVEQIRAQPIRPIDADIKQRVSDMGSKLDALYPDN